MSENINPLIINWYLQNKRDLPWRNTDNPYFIWLSEIILQQTRVNQGMAYYQKFVKHFPTIQKLANASEQEVLNNWQGLGYYSRARNLHKTAKKVDEQFNGIFPKTYKQIIELPGVGDYTASAISSFAFNEPQAVLDGNVFRVLSRIFDIDTPIDSTQGKKDFRTLAQEFLDKSRPGIHNQAMMEFGAMQCTPKSPNCGICPIILHCEGYQKKKIQELPVKSKKTKVRARKMTYLFATIENDFLIQKRTEKDIWQHLYEFPLQDETELNFSESKIAFEKSLGQSILNFKKTVSKTHLLSHQKISIDFYTGTLKNSSISNKFTRVSWTKAHDFPFPKPIEEFLREIEGSVDK